MKAKLVKIGNSRGIRLPKPIIDEAGLTDQVDLSVRHGEVVIRRMNNTRAGWANAARRLQASGDTGVIGGYIPTDFDQDEWQW